MAKEYARTQRVADHLQRELAEVLQREVRDPRVGMVSITGVEVSRDLAHAKVYYTRLGSDSADEAREVTTVLNGMAGFLRSELSRGSTMRSVPQLRFYFDASIGQGMKMDELIRQAKDADSKLGSGDGAGE